MRVEWQDVKKFLRGEIDFNTEICCRVRVDDQERIVAAAKIELCRTIMQLEDNRDEQEAAGS